MILGGRGYSDVDKLKSDKALCEIFNLKVVPDSTTIGRFFKEYSGESLSVANSTSIKAIGTLLSTIAIKSLKHLNKKEVTLDIDATYMQVYNEEAKICYKGFKSYSSLCCFVSDIGYCIDEEFMEGNISAVTGILSQLKRASDKLSLSGIKVSGFRSDSAAYQADIINYCNSAGIEFYIGADKDISILNGITNISEDSWRPYKDRYGSLVDNEEVSEFIHSMNKSKESFRVVVLKKKLIKPSLSIPELLGDNYVYKAIATNSTKSAEEVVHFYNKRGECEYYIKEAKYGFDLNHLPSGSLGANGLWFKVGMLAYNLIIFLKNNILQSDFVNRQVKSIRYLILSIGGKLISHGRQIILKLCCDLGMLKRIQFWRNECLKI
jgi:hypothetical protein